MFENTETPNTPRIHTGGSSSAQHEKVVARNTRNNKRKIVFEEEGTLKKKVEYVPEPKVLSPRIKKVYERKNKEINVANLSIMEIVSKPMYDFQSPDIEKHSSSTVYY